LSIFAPPTARDPRSMVYLNVIIGIEALSKRQKSIVARKQTASVDEGSELNVRGEIVGKRLSNDLNGCGSIIRRFRC